MSKPQNEIQLERHGDITVFDIKGDVTGSSESAVRKAYGQAQTQENHKILLKFEEDAYFNSDGIKILIQLLSESKNNDQFVAITGLSDHFKKIFGMVGIPKLATIYSTEKEALEHLVTSSG